MGMFDSLYVKCPECGADVEFQSKCGPCVLNRYSLEDVIPSVATDLDGSSEACKCGRIVVLELAQKPVLQIKGWGK